MPGGGLTSPASHDRGRGEMTGIASDSTWTRPVPVKGRLWTEGEPPLPRLSRRLSRRRQCRSLGGAGMEGKEEDLPSATNMIKQPEARPISQEQLVAEVKGIYAGLAMVEARCIEIDSVPWPGVAKLGYPKGPACTILRIERSQHRFSLATNHLSASPGLLRIEYKLSRVCDQMLDVDDAIQSLGLFHSSWICQRDVIDWRDRTGKTSRGGGWRGSRSSSTESRRTTGGCWATWPSYSNYCAQVCSSSSPSFPGASGTSAQPCPGRFGQPWSCCGVFAGCSIPGMN